MLLGEHAVLHGRRALVCAINKRITVSLTPVNTPVLRIVSDLGAYEAPLGNLKDHPDFRFVLDAVKQYPLEQGIELKIESEFSSDIGFGSSAAVTVATHAALMNNPPRPSFHSGHPSCGGDLLNSPPSEGCPQGGVGSFDPIFLNELFKRSLATIHRVQGRGSGADVAASVFGGVVAYRAEPLGIVPLAESFPLTAVYSGSKMKTADVIRLVEERRALNSDYFERIFDRMDASVGEVIQAAEVERDRRARFACPPQEETRPAVAFHQNQTAFIECLGKMLILNQKLMEEMGLCNAALAEIIGEFQSLEVPAKISGSGLGDCAIGLGDFPKIGKFQTYSLKVDPGGVL
jgi:mevalonate kinase